MVVPSYSLSTREAEARETQVQGHPHLHRVPDQPGVYESLSQTEGVSQGGGVTLGVLNM